MSRPNSNDPPEFRERAVRMVAEITRGPRVAVGGEQVLAQKHDAQARPIRRVQTPPATRHPTRGQATSP